ncbi:MAG: carbamoyltransferase HypF [Verrucomicrobiae bacterium]|nr:carbamoyltransferase HypF [Verrucomicrobiae bacterium]
MSDAPIQRLRVLIRGAVQGVGFRPFVHGLAGRLGLAGWVRNTGGGVEIEAEGADGALRELLAGIERDRPAHAVVQAMEVVWLAVSGQVGFRIIESSGGDKSAVILPDIATCPECLREILDPSDRRYRYPFTNCTHCGPRFSIIVGIPYDRARTTMRGFEMCPECRGEYDDPGNRRFHAQPNACPACGPQLALWDTSGRVLGERDAALRSAGEAIRAGKIVAVKGLGGFHLMADAGDGGAVARLRELKGRDEKPFAVMAPSADVIGGLCDVSGEELRLLRSPASPIVLLARRRGALGVSDAVAPGNPCLGVMLPYAPLHHLLMRDLGFPVVATSGNASEEPICTDEGEALRRLGGMCDLLLVHDRPIARHVDDSIARVVMGRPLLLRRARGHAPLPVTLAGAPPPALAMGAHLKNTVAVSVGRDVFLSQHIGDLETPEAADAMARAAEDLPGLYGVRPAVVACDMHPDYVSTARAGRSGLRVVRVQHHVAHVLACAAENEVAPPYLGVAWDGTGYGVDGAVWGGEFFLVTAGDEERFAALAPFRLPGGEAAVREPRRSALGALYACYGEGAFRIGGLAPLREFSDGDLRVLAGMLRRGLNAPPCTSAGRLFDAVAALSGSRQVNRFEGQAAMLLEFAAADSGDVPPYPVKMGRAAASDGGPRHVLDWRPMLEAVVSDILRGRLAGEVAAAFHAGLSEGIVAVAREANVPRVILTGGCFQNRVLLEGAVTRLREAGFAPSWHQRVPPNDGGIALGQMAALLRPKNFSRRDAGARGTD